MSLSAWSATLQWSRLGVNAALFLIVARYLNLAEIGAFAAAFAPVRLLQVVHKSGVIDAYIVSDRAVQSQNAFFALSAILGLIFTVTLALIALILPDPVAPLLAALSPIPLFYGLSAIPEAALRADLRIRALALRTLFAQLLAAALALAALRAGWGAASLAVFALSNALTTSAVSMALARVRPTALPTGAALRGALPEMLRISARELAGNASLPLLQLAVAAMLGLPAAGAFQIAARILGLLDALAISPIRYIALPRFAALAGTTALPTGVLHSLHLTSGIAAFVYLGALSAAPELARLAVGPAHGAITAPLLPAFCLLGLSSALAMPLNQSLTAIGLSRLTLRRALGTLILTALLAIPALSQSTIATAATLPLASALVLGVYARVALPVLGLEPRAVLIAIAPALLAATLMALALGALDPSLQGLNPLVRLTLKATLGAVAYAALLMAFSRLPRRPVAP
jgi:O-antigen/teichoic acid export membrane protein